ncbi:MAG: LPXTG cell wall anchor domain-containing protein [Chitinophagales bacterium]
MPISYLVYSSIGLVVITLLLFIFRKRKNR